MTLLSARNERVQRVRRLARRRRDRAEERAFVIEGPHAVEAALDAPLGLDEVFYEHGVDPALVARARATAAHVFEVSPGTLARVTDAVTPQPVVAVATWCDVPLGDVIAAVVAADGPARPVLVLHDLRDPGNVGTLLRTAEAAGVAGVVLGGTSVDVFNPKCVRASAGALFHLPVAVMVDGVEALDQLRGAGIRLIGTSATATTPYDECAFNGGVALVLGNEAHGLAPEMGAAMDEMVAIPIEGRAESLNVAAAGAVLCFEVARRRRAG